MIQVESIAGNEHRAATHVAGDPVSGDAVVIDPSVPVVEIVELLTRKGWKPRAVLLTQGDLAHAARAAELKFYFNIPLVAHEKQLLQLQRLPPAAEKAGLCGVKIPSVDRLVREDGELRFGSLAVKISRKDGEGRLVFSIENSVFDGFR